MARPKNKVEDKKETIKKVCNRCKKEKPITNYYNSTSPMFDGKVPICKSCIKELIDYNNISSIYDLLQTMDIPFLYDYYEKAKEGDKDTFGNYIRMCNSLPQIKNLHWKDSCFDENGNRQRDTFSFDKAEQELLNEFKPTREMLIRWGTKYTPEQYIKLENFYNDMKEKNIIETPQEEDYLKKLAVISMKMDEELENCNYSQVKQLGDLFSKYMADSKFRATDKSDTDKTGGIRSFSAIYAEVESDDFIPPWEHYRKIKGVDQDIVDKVIMHMENFILRLNKVEKMTEPPSDTPKIEKDEIGI